MEYRAPDTTDMEEIIRLLAMHQLPVEDLPNPYTCFILARKKDRLAGCIGLEMHQPHGLLRSFAVHPEFQNQGIGKELLNQLFSLANNKNIITLHLLTTTAEPYFSRRGFCSANRLEAPEGIKGSTEFTTLCPSSSVYMVFKNIAKYGKDSIQE